MGQKKLNKKTNVSAQSTFMVRNNFNEKYKESTYWPRDLIVMLFVAFTS